MINEIKCKNSYTGWVMDKTIRTSGNIGSVVDFTEQTTQSYNYQIIPCLAGSEFTLTLHGATYARAWCFVDKDDKIVSHADANAVVTNFQIVAPCDGKLIVNNYRWSPPNPSVTGVCRCDKIQHKDGEVRKVYCNEVLDGWVKDKYINTSGDVGSVVDIEHPSASSSKYGYQLINCQIGDKFTLTCNGGTAPRAWCFVDKDDKIVSSSNSSVTCRDTEVVATCDGKLIVHNKMDDQPNPSVKKLSKIWYPHGLVDIGANQSFSFTHTGKFLYTNGPIGGVVEFTEATDAKWGYCIVSVKKGDTFTLTCNGGAAPRAWCFTDNQRKIVSNAEAGAICTELSLTASCDGYLIVQNNFVDASENPSLVRTNAHTYPTVKIGTREWLGANLDETLGKIQADEFYYNNDKFTYGKYGKLYKGGLDVSGIVPTGWRVPTTTDFSDLASQLGSSLVGKKLKSDSFGWTTTGTDDVNFEAVGGGEYSAVGVFASVETKGIFWSSSSSTSGKHHCRYIQGDLFASAEVGDGNSYSVRLVRDLPADQVSMVSLASPSNDEPSNDEPSDT